MDNDTDTERAQSSGLCGSANMKRPTPTVDVAAAEVGTLTSSWLEVGDAHGHEQRTAVVVLDERHMPVLLSERGVGMRADVQADFATTDIAPIEAACLVRSHRTEVVSGVDDGVSVLHFSPPFGCSPDSILRIGFSRSLSRRRRCHDSANASSLVRGKFGFLLDTISAVVA